MASASPSATAMAPEDLVTVLRSAGIPIDTRALSSALSDAELGPAFSEWARVHLGRDTFLSRDEHDQYMALERSGKAAKLAASNLGSAIPLSGDELKRSTDELRQSTEAIAKQTEILKQQQEAFLRLVKTSGQRNHARADFEAKQLQQWDTKRKHAAAEVSELSRVLEFNISDTEQQGRVAESHLQQTIDDALRSDDKLLLALQKLGWELENEDPDEQDNIDKLREICARLIKFTVETIRTRLDRLYLEAIDEALRSQSRDKVSSDGVSALQEELESLYAEILPVAQMSVEQQHLGPALQSLSGRNGQSANISREALHYIDACLDFLLDHMELLSIRAQAFKKHQIATQTVISTARAELAIPVPAIQKEPRRIAGASPARRRKSSGNAGGSSPVRTRTTSGPRRRSSGANQVDLPPLEQLLQILALVMPQQDDGMSGDAPNGSANINAVAASLADRSRKMADVAGNVQESFEAAAASQLADGRRALQAVRDSVLAESPFGDVNLVDPEIDSSIAVLTQEAEKIKLRLAEADKDLGKARGRNVKREELISRWRP